MLKPVCFSMGCKEARLRKNKAIVFVIAVLLLLSAGCAAEKKEPVSSPGTESINFDEVQEFFPAGELNRQVSSDVRPVLEEVFGGAKLTKVFVLQNGSGDNAGVAAAGRHFVYVLRRAASEEDAAAIAAMLQSHEPALQVTQRISGDMPSISYDREVEGVLYRISIGYRPGEQRAGISVYPAEHATVQKESNTDNQQ